MVFIYLYGMIGIILLVYTIIEREKLLFYREINQMKNRKIPVRKMHIPFSRFSRIIPAIATLSNDTSSNVLFTYRARKYVATSLGESDILVSSVAD